MDLNKVLKRSLNAPWQESEKEVLVLTPQQSTVHELNKTAAWIWKNIDGFSTGNDLVEKMIRAFDVEKEMAASDFQKIIVEMSEKGLLDDT